MADFITPAFGAVSSIIGAIKGNKEAKQRKKEADAAYKPISSAYGDFSNRFKDYGGEAYNYGKGTRDFADEKYRAMFDEIEGGGGSGGGGGGGVPGYGGELDQYKTFWDKMGATGAPSEDQVNALRGWGTFKDFATTGGWNDQDKVNFRNRALSGTPQLFDSLKSGMQRSRAAQGGYAPGYSASMGAMARDKASAMRDAALGAETSLADSIRSGRQWGAKEGSGAEQGVINNQMTGNREGMSIAESIAAQNRNAAAANAARASAGAGASFNDRMRILDEMRQLRGETGAEMPYGDMELKGIGGQANIANARYGQQAQQGQQGGGGIWGQLAQGALGAAGSLIGGGSKKPKEQMGPPAWLA